MKLMKKIAIYSGLLSGLILIFFLIYTLALLPGLYREEVRAEKLSAAKKVLTQIDENSDPASFPGIDPAMWFLRADLARSEMYVGNQYGTVKFHFKGTAWTTLFSDPRSTFRSDKRDDVMIKTHLEELGRFFQSQLGQIADVTLIKAERSPEVQVMSDRFSREKDGFSYESEVKMNGEYYQNNMVMRMKDDTILMVFSPAVINSFSLMNRTIYRSLPMFLLGLVFFLLLASWIFSKKIADPILLLAERTRRISDPKTGANKVFVPIDTRDEVGELSEDIKSLYERWSEEYLALKAEVERRKIFMRSTEHQLKTPLASAILLTDSMKDKIGRFADHEVYLPKLKEILADMQKMIDRLLEDEMAEDVFEEADMYAWLTAYARERKTKTGLTMTVSGQTRWRVAQGRLNRIVDVICANAEEHGPQNGSLVVRLSDKEIDFVNPGAHFPDDIAPAVGEAFVTGTHKKGRGLGLYLARLDAERQNMTLVCRNTDEGVLIRLIKKE